MSNLRASRRTFLAFLLALGTLGPLCPDASAVGEAGAQFLKIPVGPRACAMGGSSVAIADDPSATYWNPAGLTYLDTPQIMGMHASWLEGTSYQYFAAVLPRAHGHFGVAFSYSSSGKMPGRDVNFEVTEEYGAYDIAGTLAYARDVTSALSAGCGIKLIQQKIEEEKATGIALDLGIVYKMPIADELRAGVSVQNLGPEITFIEESDPLPLNFKGGLAYVDGPFTLAGSIEKPRFSEMRLHLGGEYLILDILALRAGFKTRPEMDNAFTGGFGVLWQDLRIEYAFVPFEEINDTHYLALTVIFE